MKRYIAALLALTCVVLAIPSGVSAACVNPPPGLASWWPGEGNANDVIGGNPGIVSGGISFTAGAVGQAFRFDGTSGSIMVPASTNLNVGAGPGFTVECWIKPADLTPLHPIVEWNDGARLGVHFYHSTAWCGDHFAGNLLANITDTGGNYHPLSSGPGLLTTSNFQHVALAYDKASGVGTLYINGTVVASAVLGSFTPQTSYDLYLGERPGSGVPLYLYGGLMDEVSVYNRALSLREIRAIYVAGASGKCRPSAPFIVSQPSSQATVVGGNASFNVVAGGTQPLSYQWRLEGNALSGATGSVLNLSNVQLSDAGNYSVVVANLAGSVTSSNALLTVSTGGCVTASSSLVSWWPAEGNGNDVAGSNPGTVSGVSYIPGEVGQAFNFSGTNGSVFVPASGSLNVGLSNGLTIECWIKPGDLTVRHPLVEWNNGGTFGVHLYVSQDWNGGGGPGDLFANITDTGAGWHPIFTGPGVLNTSNWQHVAVTYDKTSGLGKLYLNGAQVASANLGIFTPQTSYNLYFGRRASPEVVPPYVGGMDEVSVYSRALSAGEIQNIYNAGSQGKCGTQGGLAPSITTQPASQTVNVGANVTFSVVADGTQPLSYQWRFGGTNLSGATGSSLSVSNVQMSAAGPYSVVVSNAFGSALSSNATLTVNQAVCTNAPAGLVSWWPAEANGNDIAGSNPGAVSGGVTYSAGEVGQAFNFNGTNRSVFVPAAASLNVGLSNGLTIECWIKPGDLSVRHPLVEWNNGGTFGVHFYVSQDWNGGGGPGDLFANITDTGGGWHPVFTSPGVLNTSNWQHVAVTYDKTSGLGRLYLNGAQVASAALGSFTPQTSYNLYFGLRASPEAVQPYLGGMDEVSLYNRALSAGEIQTIFNAGSLGKCQGGVAPFIINQPASQTVAAGTNATFGVSAGGTQPLSYQWRFRGTNLNGATSSLLSLSDVQSSDAGTYSAVVSNAFGSVTSSNAVLTVNTGACVNAAGGIVSWWPAEGNGNDVAGSNPGLPIGVSYTVGEVGQAFNFNTSTGTVFMAASPSLNVGSSNGFTVECWIKPSDFTPLHPLVEWNNGSSFGVHFYHSTSWFGDNIQGNLLANIVDTSGGYHPVYSAAGVLSSNNLQHVALTYDKASGVGKLYVNGVQVANASLGSFTPQTSYNLYLGKRASGGVPSYSGLMDEVSLYGRALSQGEIQGIYNAGGAGKCHSSGVSVAEVPPGTMMISKALPGGFDVSFKGIPGREYEIQRAPSISGPWTTLTTVLVEPDGSGFYVDTDAPASEAFYRNVIR